MRMTKRCWRAIEVHANGATGHMAAVPAAGAEAHLPKPVSLPATGWTRQGSCPECRGESEIDLLDLVGGVMKLHCLACAHVWSVHRPDDAGTPDAGA